MNLEAFPEPLSPEQENECATRKSDGDCESLIMHSMREAYLYAYRCCRGNLEPGEIISACYLGLRDAAKNFSPNRIRFFAYSKPYVRGRIIAEFRGKDVVKKAKNQESLDVHIPPPDSEHEESTVEKSFHEPANDDAKDELASLDPVFQKALTEKERFIIEMRYKGGLNFRQIGALLGVTRSNTQHEHQNALRKIRTELMLQKRLFER